MSTCGAPSAATVHSDSEGKTVKGVSESSRWKRADGTRDVTQIDGHFLKLRLGLSEYKVAVQQVKIRNT